MEALLLRLNKMFYHLNLETNAIERGQMHSVSSLKQDLLHDGYKQTFRYIQRPQQTNQLVYNQIFLPSNLVHTHAIKTINGFLDRISPTKGTNYTILL